jgi:asparagine synthase (glutamine-hydrolysing)
MLKRLGVDNVICFSYGVKGNRESEISRQVAVALGYTWHFVEITKKVWYHCYHSDEIQEIERYAGNLTSLPFLQDYCAVKVLKEEGKIPNNSVFVPGHTGDMISGGHIPNNIWEKPPNCSQFINHTFQRHYVLWKWNKKESNVLTKILQQRIQKSIGEVDVHDTESLANAIEYFNFYQRQAKFIVNSVRVYEFFGYNWRIPLWDSKLIDFFLKIPLDFRINQNLYKKYASDVVFNGDLKILCEINCTKSLPNTVNKITLNKILDDILDRYYFTFTPGTACIEKYPFFSRIRDRIVGHPFNKYPNYPLINEILNYTQKNKQIPLGNGLLSLGYLTRFMK